MEKSGKLINKLCFAINPHSFIDVITNSSSELFVCDIDKSLETVKEMLESYPGLSGYDEPWIFKVDEFIKAKENNFERTFMGFERDYRYQELDGWMYVSNSDIFIIDERKNYIEESDKLVKFIDWHERNKIVTDIYNEMEEQVKLFPDETPAWWIDPFKASKYGCNYDARDYDNNIIIQSQDDNSIPYEYFDIIEKHFNATRIHMG